VTDDSDVPEDPDHVRNGLAASFSAVQRGRTTADQLCASFVDRLDVDGAALAVIVSANLVSTSLGTSGSVPHELMELQFMLGEGPCMETMRTCTPVMAADLNGSEATRWPTFAHAASRLGVRATFALPVTVAGFPIGALLLHRNHPGPLVGANLVGAFFAADLAVLPLLDVMTSNMDTAADDTSTAGSELAALNRSEVYQATGVLIAQLGVTPAEALVRLRAHSFSHGRTTSQTAYDILEHRLRLDDDRTSTEQPEDGLE
jgi:hypothetical protein